MSATDVGLRWARELRRQYGGTSAAKRIARDFGVEVRTAAAWMQGGVPFVRHLCRAADLCGAAFVLRVLSPDSELAGCADVDQAIDVLRRRVDDLNRRIARLKGRRVMVDGFILTLAGILSRLSDRLIEWVERRQR